MLWQHCHDICAWPAVPQPSHHAPPAAKAYIAKLKASADPDDDSGAFLSDQLQQEAREASGRTLRPIAAHVNLPEDVSTSPYGDGRLVRGHRLAATAVALSHDDATAFSATKCGALLRIDVETGKRCGAFSR